MTQHLKLTAGTGAITDGNQVAFSLQAKHFRNGGRPVVSVKGIAGSETVSFWIRAGDDWEELDSDGTGGASSQTQFVEKYAADVFNGPGVYGITKTATAAPIYIYVDDGR